MSIIWCFMSRLPILFWQGKRKKKINRGGRTLKDSRRDRKEKTSKQSRRHGIPQWAIASKTIQKLEMKFSLFIVDSHANLHIFRVVAWKQKITGKNDFSNFFYWHVDNINQKGGKNYFKPFLT